MSALRKLMVSLMAIVFSCLISIWSLMWGWGLTPHNWSIIVWACVLQFSVVVFQTIGSSDNS